MRVCFLIPALLLSACATAPASDPEQPQPVETVSASPDALPPQTLVTGECGLFGWDAGGSSRFIFFAKGDSALYADGRSVRSLQAHGEFPATDYGAVQLDLGPEEAMVDGLRYAQARLTEVLDDGFRRVQPLVVLQSCGNR